MPKAAHQTQPGTSAETEVSQPKMCPTHPTTIAIAADAMGKN